MNENLRLVWDIDNTKLQEATKELEALRQKYGATEVAAKKSAQEAGSAFKSAGEQLHKITEIAKQVIAALAVKEVITEWIHLSDEMHKMRRQAAAFSSEVGPALDAIAVKAHSIGKTFSEDYSQILKTASVLSDEYQVTMTQALKSIEEGFKRGSNATANYNQLFQLGAHNARQAGYTYDQFLKIIDRVAASGVRAQRVITTIFDKKQSEDGSKYAYILAAANEEQRKLTAEQQKYYDYMTHWLEKEELFIAAQQTAVNAWGITTRTIKEKYLPILTELITKSFGPEMRENFNATMANMEHSGESLEELGNTYEELLIKQLNVGTEIDALNAKKKWYSTDSDKLIELSFEYEKIGTELMVVNQLMLQAIKLSNDKKLTDAELAKINAALRYEAEAKALEKYNAELRKMFPYLQAITSYVDKSVNKIKEFGKALLGQDERPAAKDPNKNLVDRIELMSTLYGVQANQARNEEKASEARMKLTDKEIKAFEDAEETKAYLQEHGFEIASNFTNQMYDLKSQRIQAELDQLNEETQNLLSNDKLADYQRERIERGANKRRKALLIEEAKNKKSQATFSAIISTAEAIAEALPNYILAAIVAASGAAQVAFIQAQPLPKMKKGGPIQGPAHEQGGVVVEAEGGEFVINKIAARRYDSILKQINSMQLNTDVLINGKKPQEVKIGFDSPEMLKELKRLKTTNINIDERGFMVRQWNLYGSQKRQVHRFFD